MSKSNHFGQLLSFMPNKKNKEGTKRQYTFDVSKADDIFDYLMKVKFIMFMDNKKRSIRKRNLRKKISVNGVNLLGTLLSTICILKILFKTILIKVIDKQDEAMEIDRQPFLEVAEVAVVTVNLASLKDKKKVEIPQQGTSLAQSYKPNTPLVFCSECSKRVQIPTRGHFTARRTTNQ